MPAPRGHKPFRSRGHEHRMPGMRGKLADASLHDLRAHRMLRDNEWSRTRAFEVERPSAHTRASKLGALVHVVLRVQRLFELAIERGMGAHSLHCIVSEDCVINSAKRWPTNLQRDRCSKRYWKDSVSLRCS